ncbi:hypothetical protein Dsin_002375 [Dipteronia sinensis]|uniref:Photosystem II cytochrome b559 alpha subunit lumenal region domain-containing protein n=1 Tax=Dipteronia sinensis TaxID=43782 RepID=A0AAE0B7D6_9ROSI|nr:hypothetical protein Dsin_002375 [Dipteronia sinensis]
MWSSACLEAQENVLLLILLPVFDTGSFIANLYLSYLLDELRGWLFVSTGLASSSGIGKKHRPNDYFTKSRQGIPLITGRFDPLAQLDSFSISFIRGPSKRRSKERGFPLSTLSVSTSTDWFNQTSTTEAGNPILPGLAKQFISFDALLRISLSLPITKWVTTPGASFYPPLSNYKPVSNFR